MIGEAVYMRATHPGSPFFVDSRSLMAHAEESWDPEPDCPIGWASNKSVVWTYMQPTACIMRTHGWKIHVTASLDNAQSVLEKVSKICISEHVMFKYLRDKQQYRSSNTKYAGRSSSGKFITIYPFSDEHLERLTLKLEEAIGGEPGPYILSDLRYNNGPIFFRYGAFVSIEMSDAEGEKISLIPDADGVLKEDIRGVRPIIPHGVPIPPVVNEAYEAYNKNLSTELDNYVDLKAVHFSNAGGVYSARNRDDEQVILKEARPYAGLDDNKQDATTRLAHEWSILKHAEHLGITPKPLKQFKVWEHHFVEMECITGTPFNDWITEHMPIVRDSYQAMQDYKQRSLQIAHLLIDTVEKLHTTGYAHGDLQLANVFVSENDDAVRLIDLEAARNLKDTNPPAMNAMGFQPPKHCTAEQADWFAVSRLIATLFDIQNNITILSPEYWSVFLKRIQEAFGEEPVSLINSLNERYPGENGIVVVPATPTESIRPYTWKLPQQQVSLHDIQLISNQTVKGIEATRHAVPGKLFPADAKLESNYSVGNSSWPSKLANGRRCEMNVLNLQDEDTNENPMHKSNHSYFLCTSYSDTSNVLCW